ncbi:hypothetical protein KOW79_011897 [Hemibagrus wyckioides]|uniref:Uncharacterized protein n=1 Tax=Hemibagrus wyckioides TaxID=337641 RepID=A0A9D3NJQ3_9TELE|nr:hypothetical protein KOW79_011897 [Hemibagrus wyckioides]
MPRPSLLIMALVPKTHKIEPESYSIIPSSGYGHPAKGIRGAGRQGLGQAVARLAADRQPTPEINYELFNCSNFNIAIGAGITRLLAPDLPSMGPHPWV